MIRALVGSEGPRPVGIDRQLTIFGIDRLTGVRCLLVAGFVGVGERRDLAAIRTQIVIGQQIRTAIAGADRAVAFLHLEGCLANGFGLVVHHVDVDFRCRRRSITVRHRKIERQIGENIRPRVGVIQVALKLEGIAVLATFLGKRHREHRLSTCSRDNRLTVIGERELDRLAVRRKPHLFELLRNGKRNAAITVGAKIDFKGLRDRRIATGNIILEQGGEITFAVRVAICRRETDFRAIVGDFNALRCARGIAIRIDNGIREVVRDDILAVVVDPFIGLERPRPVGIDRQRAMLGIHCLAGTRGLLFTVFVGVGELEDQRAVGADIVVRQQIVCAVV